MLFPLHNFASFQSNLVTGQIVFLVYTCTKWYCKSGSYGVALLSRGVKFLRILRIVLDPQKQVPAEKNTSKIKDRKNLLPLI